ncbi:hypothetical protein [Mesorhizobium sp. INR15]|uniref:hypothetical protein n=1 Tax=Mesorhizobium sp. INR15 TaxID=2654248 RepID=UPI0018965E46|nr:hypothetical protein [Mesorhizobium sp. INR15]QPC91450.1 hypothetical protein GA829_12985 [Mesorhizobium sp. INR15]
MVDHGHPDALSYPIWKVFEEASFVVKRINAHMAMQTSLLQMALSTIPNMSVKDSARKTAARELSKHLKGMIDGE